MTNLSSVDTTIITVFKREILEIEARGINVSPVVLNYLSERVKNNITNRHNVDICALEILQPWL